MLFNSWAFSFAFLPIVLGGYYLSKVYASPTIAKAWLGFASLAFYAWWSVGYLFVLLASTIANFYVAQIITNHRSGIDARSAPLSPSRPISPCSATLSTSRSSQASSRRIWSFICRARHCAVAWHLVLHFPEGCLSCRYPRRPARPRNSSISISDLPVAGSLEDSWPEHRQAARCRKRIL